MRFITQPVSANIEGACRPLAEQLHRCARVSSSHVAAIGLMQLLTTANNTLRHMRIQGAAEKSGPLNFFAVFSATVWDFNTKFYSFIY